MNIKQVQVDTVTESIDAPCLERKAVGAYIFRRQIHYFSKHIAKQSANDGFILRYMTLATMENR